MLKTTYDALAVDGLKKPLAEITLACRPLGINFFIVGAIARNIWLATHDKSPSGTRDIDFGVFVPNVSTYNQLRKVLVKDFKYTQSRENAFCLFTPEGKQIDLLPFGEIEEDREVSIEGVGLTSVKLDGFKEIFERGTIDVEIGRQIFRTCSIPGIVILKMIAYDDRPGRRGKDVEDIDAICQHYPILEDENIWTNHSDLYDGGLDHFEVGMMVLGREMSRMISGNERLYKRVAKIITKAIHLQSGFTSLMIKDPEEETIDQKRQLLRYILRGLEDGNR